MESSTLSYPKHISKFHPVNRGIIYLLDWLFLNIFYLSVNVAIYSDLYLNSTREDLLLLMNIVWVVVTGWTKKFNLKPSVNLKDIFLRMISCSLYMVYLVSIFIAILGLSGFSRFFVFTPILALLIVELAVYLIYFPEVIKYLNLKDILLSSKSHKFVVPVIVVDLFLLLISFYLCNVAWTGQYIVSRVSYQVFLFVIGAWILSASWTRKFEKNTYKNFICRISPFIKSFMMTVACIAFTLVLFKIHMNYSRLMLFMPVFLLFFLEIPFVYFIYRLELRDGSEGQDIGNDSILCDQNGLNVHNRISKRAKISLYEVLHSGSKDIDKTTVNFIDENIDTRFIESSEVIICGYKDWIMKSLHRIHEQYMIVGLTKINEIRRINKYLLVTHRALINGGYFVGKCRVIDDYKSYLWKKYPQYLAKAAYLVHFFYHRMMPKLPILKKVYFFLSRGRDRVISKAELLGRLYFCGFEIENLYMNANTLYFIVKKTKMPSMDENPSYGPIVKLPRVGFMGRVFEIYKFRTMYPYSEYIQSYIFENNRLRSSGKFKDDFRVTEWGKVFRKLFIDEIPQIFNFLRGDIGLVGVRALSLHYYYLYPEDLRQWRIQHKPGLIPPYYADLPDSFEKILESERRYLLRKQKHPFITDFRYFTLAIYNILFRRARSV